MLGLFLNRSRNLPGNVKRSFVVDPLKEKKITGPVPSKDSTGTDAFAPNIFAFYE